MPCRAALRAVELRQYHFVNRVARMLLLCVPPLLIYSKQDKEKEAAAAAAAAATAAATAAASAKLSKMDLADKDKDKEASAIEQVRHDTKAAQDDISDKGRRRDNRVFSPYPATPPRPSSFVTREEAHRNGPSRTNCWNFSHLA